MAQIAAPKWFFADLYYANKLAALGAGWTQEKLDAAFLAAGYSLDNDGLYRHFVEYGNAEGLSPNSFFSTDQYLANKTAQFFNVENPTADQISHVAKLIEDAGMTPWDHFHRYGWKEDVDPSDSFDVSQYLADKLEQLGSGWTTDKLVETLAEHGLNPITHYVDYGKSEGLDAKAPPAVGGETDPPANQLIVKLMDVKNADINGQPLTENPFAKLTFTYQADSESEAVPVTLYFKMGGYSAMFSGPTATYESLCKALTGAVAAAGYGDVFTVSLGAEFRAYVDSGENSYSAEGKTLVITPTTGSVSIAPDQGLSPSSGIVIALEGLLWDLAVKDISASTTAAPLLSFASWEQALATEDNTPSADAFNEDQVEILGTTVDFDIAFGGA